MAEAALSVENFDHGLWRACSKPPENSQIPRNLCKFLQKTRDFCSCNLTVVYEIRRLSQRRAGLALLAAC